jgi:hypothetical protein
MTHLIGHAAGTAKCAGAPRPGGVSKPDRPQSLSPVPTHPHGPTGVKMTDHVQVTPGAGVEVHVVVKPG